ncbi:mandelate racemase/muconate lactonizing enzyme family protein [Micromonospora sp. WMMA1363]|uniref:mandelate racemase/muconate lactonizing enzyme family protein n=1 Tax=Micromonospora sp. WMMA1363 TaxID=3053985 RepID=UPI00259C7A0F|nr:mandelate racemase/muconate lactonizing enzyme family protein [Micromonospora sp. WMMA1363]MDM4718708.1 mandelate racemase/muconate lactonizing enzyme family protein [Micromonospora sp. WMMA1363]
MKITNIRLDRLRLDLDPPFAAAWDPTPRRHFDATVVRVETDEGIVGVGSGDTMDGFAAHRDLFIGHDPRNIARHVRAIETINFHGGRCWPLEVALWDIIGQATGQPVATLFGNAQQRIRAYASSGELKPPAARVESALALREQGFRAMKIRIDRDRLDEGVATVAATREAVGDDFDIMVDLNQSWRMAGDVDPALDLTAVRRVIAQLDQLGVYWVEEPLPYPDRAGFKTLRAGTTTRIAAGEMLDSVRDVVSYLEEDILDVYQMDVVLAVGMSRARTLAELAQFKHRTFTPHTWTNGIGLLANLHVAAGVGGSGYLEYPYDPPGWTPERRDFMLRQPVPINDGYVEVPQAPGIGAQLDEEAISRWRLQ